MLKKKIPLDIDNFSDLVNKDNNYAFVDKTLLIKAVLDASSNVTLITRPRRWGKTLNMSMLQHFFAPSVLGRSTKGLFDGLKIAEAGDCYMKQQGQYPVIFISFKDVKENNSASFINNICDLMQKVFREHADQLLNSKQLNNIDKDLFTNYAKADVNESALASGLLALSELLYKHYNSKVQIIIDEYDTPLNHAYNKKYVDSIIDFMKKLFSRTLKGNDYLEKGIMTGILRVSKDSMLSGLNNLKVFSVLDDHYAPYFGFNDTEVAQLFYDCGLKHEVNAVRQYYNGYHIGDQRLYNPWSITHCLDESGTLTAYWVNTADNSLLKQALLNATAEIKTQFQQLLLSPDSTIHTVVNETMRFEDLNSNGAGLWTILLAMGYLTATDKTLYETYYQCQLAIPNEEVKQLYLTFFKSWLRDTLNPQNYHLFLEDLTTGRIDEFTAKIEKYLLTYGSGYEFKDESNYHTFMLGLLCGLSDYYHLFSNGGAGLGRADLLLMPKDDTRSNAIILELKHHKEDKKLQKHAITALKQIEAKRYDAFANRYQNIKKVLKIGIAFSQRQAASCYRWDDDQDQASSKTVTHQLTLPQQSINKTGQQ